MKLPALLLRTPAVRASRLVAALLTIVVLALPVFVANGQDVRAQREETRPDEMADLAVRSLTVAPEYPQPRELTQIRLEVENRSSARQETVEVAFFVNGQPLTTRSIQIKQQATQSITVPWTPNAAGNFSLSAVIDPRHVATERDRIDNIGVVDVVVANRPAAAADLAVKDVQVTSVRDQPTTLRLTLTNDGSTRASAPLVVRQGNARRVLLVGPIEPGKSLSIDLPWGADQKDPITAEINPRFKTAEARQANNLLLRDTRPGVDLRVEDLALSTTTFQADRPRNVTVTFRIVNTGQQSITRSFRTRIEPGTINPDGPFFVNTTGLPAGGVAYVSHTIRNAPGQFVVTVAVDVDNEISESNKNNNTATISFKNPAPDINRWVSIGPHRITGVSAQGYGWSEATGRLSAIAIDPTAPQTVYVGAQQAGVWKTTNAGADWVPVADAATVRVAALALDPSNSSRVFLVTPNEGVFRSNDSGTSWVQISTFDLDAVVHGNVFLINPDNPKDMVVASTRGVYHSVDGGVNWALKLGGGTATGLIRLPTNTKTLYAAIFHGSDDNVAGIYQSFDSGETWSAKIGCPGGTVPLNDANTIIRLAVSGGQLFASYRKNDPMSFKLFRTTDRSCSIGGALDVTWEPGWSTTGDDAQKLWSGMWVDPSNPRTLYLGGTVFWRSTNRGSSFSITSSSANSAHDDHHNVATDPVSPNVIYTLNDGGIFQSTNRGASGSWKLFGGGIANVEFYDLASAATRPDVVIGGTQDNGTMKSVGGAINWTMIRGGDGATVDIDPTNPDVMYAMFQYASSVARSTNGGGSFSPSAGGLPTGAQCFNLHYLVHSRFPNKLLASCMSLWQTVNSGTSWSTILTPANSSIVRSAVDGDGDVFYTGSSAGVISRAPAGTTWTSIFTHPMRFGVTDLELDPDNAAILYASFGSSNVGRVYRLVRSGTTFTAKDITFDLPINRAVRTLAVDRNNLFTLYVGTDKGVYRGRSPDGGTTWFWVSYMNGLPPVDVRELEVHPGTGVMRAATFGRSAYEVNTSDPMGSVLSVQGKITFLRVHEVGGGFGPPTDAIDGEVIVKFDSEPLKAFGFQLRTDGNEEAHRGMLKALRDGLRGNRIVQVEYIRTGLRTGRVIRVVNAR